MARTLIIPTYVNRSQLTASTAVPATPGDTVNGNSVPNDGFTYLYVTTTDGASPHNFSVQLPNLIDGQAITSRTYTVPAGTTSFYITGVFPTNQYGPQLLIDSTSNALQFRAFSNA